jgi:hypothetical protein
MANQQLNEHLAEIQRQVEGYRDGLNQLHHELIRLSDEHSSALLEDVHVDAASAINWLEDLISALHTKIETPDE